MDDLIVSVGADITGFLSKIDAAKAKVGQLTEKQGELKTVINDLNTSLRLNEKELTTAAVKLQKLNTTSAEGKTAAANLRKEISALSLNSKTLGDSLNTAKTSLASTTTGLKVATGELKLAEKATGGFAGGASKAFGALRTLANIIPGIGIGGLVALIAGPLVSAFESLFLASNKASSAVKDIAEDIHEGGKEYAKASANVNELTINIDLAKKGFLDKKAVLKEYNDTIGKTTGQVATLDEAEKALVKNGPAYIQMMLLKGAANFALESASKKAVEAEEARLKAAEEFLTTGQKFIAFTAGLSSAPGAVPGQAQAEATAAAFRKEVAEKEKNAAIKRAADASKQQLDIAKKFQTDAAAIAKTFKFDFFGGDGDGKGKPKAVKAIETISGLLKALYKDIADNNTTADLLGIDKAKDNIALLGTFITNAVKKFNDSPERQGALLKVGIDLEARELAEKLKQRTTGIGPVARVEVPLDFIPPKASDVKELVGKTFEQVLPEVERLNQQMADIMKTGLTDSISGIGEAIGTAIGGGGNLAESIFSSLFNVLEAGLKQLGETMIALGTAKIFIEKFALSPGIGTVIAGVATVALAAALKAAIPTFATGGFVSGPGTKTSDSINARLSKGEYVIKADSVSKYGKSFFDMINGGGLSRNNSYAAGGMVSGNIGGGQLITVEVIGRLSGTDMLLQNKRAALRVSRNG